MRLLCTIVLITGVSATAAAAAEERVTLRFDWPDELSGRATITVGHTAQQNDNPKTEWEGRSSVRFTMSPVAGDLLMTFENGPIDVVTNTGTGAERQISEIVLSMDLRRPDYRISRDGAFLGLDRLPEFLRSIEPEVQPLIAQIPPDDLPILKPSIADAMGHERLEFHARSRWDQQVGRWVNREVGSGKPEVVDEPMDLPLANNATMPARVSYRFIDHVPCDDRGDGSCFELEFRSVADGPEATAAHARNLRQGGSDIDVDRFQLVTTTRVISDPDTLLPYQGRTDWSQTIDLSIGGSTYMIRQSGYGAITYEYD